MADAVETYLDSRLADANERTIVEYRNATRRLWRELPELAALDVADLDIPHMLRVQDVYASRPGNYRHARSAIAQALDWAARLGLRSATNPARGQIAKGYKHRSKRPSTQLIAAFFPSIDACEARQEVEAMIAEFYRLATLTGLRHLELARLRVGDVDTSAKSILIKMKARGRAISIDEEMPVGDWAIEILERRIQAAQLGWLFPAPFRGAEIRRAQIWERWPPILRELERRGIDVLDRVSGTKIVPSVTRSIAAKIRDRNNVSLIVSQRSMGHRRLQTTASYCPALEDEVRSAMALVERTLMEPTTTPTPITITKNKPKKVPPVAVAPEVESGLNLAAELGRRIQARRKELGHSMAVTAALYQERTNTTCSRQGWAYWETHGCNLEQLEDVAQVLKTTPKHLLGFE